MSCTGSVPVWINWGIAAGSGAELQEGPEMSYICGGNSATSRNAGGPPADLPKQGAQGGVTTRTESRRVVPDLYRRALRSRVASFALVALLFPPLYVFAVLMDWDDRRHGVTR